MKITETNTIEKSHDSQELLNSSESKFNNTIGDFNNKIVPLRSVIICASCQGDLFTV